MSFHISRIILAVLLALIAPNLAYSTDSITPSQASHYVGQYAQVCGIVASATYAERDRGQPTFLNLDRAFPNHVFTAVIWGSNRTKFSYRPESLKGKRICVDGRIEEYRGKPQIEVYQPSQIEFSS